MSRKALLLLGLLLLAIAGVQGSSDLAGCRFTADSQPSWIYVSLAWPMVADQPVDTDGDGIGDGAEKDYWGENWYRDSGGSGDGIYNPLDADADDDGIPDGLEIDAGKDPADPGSSPHPIAVPVAEAPALIGTGLCLWLIGAFGTWLRTT